MFDHYHKLIAHQNNSDFWTAFSAELLAGVIILIVGSFLVPKYLDWRKKPNLVVINPRTRNSTFYINKAHNGFWQATLELVIKNKTSISQREWFWHLIVPAELNPQMVSLDQTVNCQNNELIIAGKKWRHYFGCSTPKEVIFPNRTLRFNYELKVMTSEKEARNYQIFYYFNTEFGTWPRKAGEIESIAINPEIDPTIAFGPEYLGSINLEPES